MKGEKCFNGTVIFSKPQPKTLGLRLASKPIHQSTRDNDKELRCTGLIFKPPTDEVQKAYVPLRSVSVEATINAFAADVTLTQVFVNQEENHIEAIYVFPIEENAAVYSFTAQINNKTITAVLKEKAKAEKEYNTSVQQGHTSVLLRQSKETLDTFTINVGALPPGKECRVKIQYVTELDLVDNNAIRFVVPTTIAPRYNPSLGHLQSPDKTKAEYVQKTPYSMDFRARVLRSEEFKVVQVANLSHAVNASMTGESIDVSMEGIALDRDIILDIDIPPNHASPIVSVESYNESAQYAVALAFTPSLADFLKISKGREESNTEFIFIVDCSGSMSEGGRIDHAREAMLLFIRSLPVGSRFNIIRFGSHYDILYNDEVLTMIYNEENAKKAETLTRSMDANFGGTELLQPLQYLKDHPPAHGRSRQIFLLTDGEISNTDQVIELCRSMSATTRIFSFGLGYSPSRALVKGLARATNGYFVFVPPDAKVDSYVGSQLGRALQPSLVNARLQWHGLSVNGSQAPQTIPPLYINDRVLVYALFAMNPFEKKNASVDVMIDEHKISSIRLSDSKIRRSDTIRRLAAKALIQELEHKNRNGQDVEDRKAVEERILQLSLDHGILSAYTAFVGVETSTPKDSNIKSVVRHIPIQISKGDEHLFQSSFSSNFNFMNYMQPQSLGVGPGQYPIAMSFAPAMSHRHGAISGMGLPGMRGPPPRPSGFAYASAPMGAAGLAADYDGAFVSTTTPGASLSHDPVRWLIRQQSFNGLWKLSDSDIRTLTSGKELSAFSSSVTQNRDALSTALVIAVLESKHGQESNLWSAVVSKGRKQLLALGLNSSEVNLLIGEIKQQL
ncbi:unnamed protein product [Adineta ricciae]|uniref:Uncharacterized protein n=1 Tax=Adineta ricciae TaxID=249248 RepID=A0A815JM91_ADIRI|nr:unnamed protein product [Adineta ricciae]